MYILVWFLPWSVICTVFFSEKMGIDAVRFWKELLLCGIGVIGIFFAWKHKKKISLDHIDMSIIAYIAILVFVSLYQGSAFKEIIFWLRYDAEFLIAFLLIRKVSSWWCIRFTTLAKIFLLSWGCMLAMSLLVRYIFGEMLLTVFGFSGQVSVWDSQGAPPIFHGIPWASIVRFQGLLEGPNQMAFFLLVYVWVFLQTFFRSKKYLFINTCIVFLLFILLVLTYSRSGLLGFMIAIVCVFGLYGMRHIWHNVSHFFQRKIWKKYVSIACVLVLWVWIFALQFGAKFQEVIARKWSTSAHFERMYIGYQRFRNEPFGQGLSQAGPASRYFFDISHEPLEGVLLNEKMQQLSQIFKAKNPDFVFSTEHYYIPESWFIQQLIEWWLFGFLVFCLIFGFLLFSLQKYPFICASLAGILVMNVFLHSFESTHTSLVLCMFLALLTNK